MQSAQSAGMNNNRQYYVIPDNPRIDTHYQENSLNIFYQLQDYLFRDVTVTLEEQQEQLQSTINASIAEMMDRLLTIHDPAAEDVA